MKTLRTALLLTCLAACRAQPPQPDYGRPLPFGTPALLPLRGNEPPPDLRQTWLERYMFAAALERSILWTRTRYSEQFFPTAGISHGRALASLERFEELLATSQTPEEFDRRVKQEFDFYKSAGWDGAGGGVLFTGYYTPILDGRPVRDEMYRYPLYALPPDLVKDELGATLGRQGSNGLEPYPTRRAIEAGGLLAGRGLELAYLRDPLDAFIAHVNGSAFIRIGDGSLYRLGYSGKNGQPYTSLGGELVRDDWIDDSDISLVAIRRWGREHPELVREYLARNDSYVFFTPIEGNPRGSLNVEVTPERTLATDKRLFPRGALVFVDTRIPLPTGGFVEFQKLLFDQDTGGAIRTAGRADIYFGIGPDAEARAGATRAEGQMIYMFLKR
ncbi:MAG: murein transglycosylase [Planctomycetota bacterium]|nr:MAG: murein transglycosylase [Planctomycetota bacterium]